MTRIANCGWSWNSRPFRFLNLVNQSNRRLVEFNKSSETETAGFLRRSKRAAENDDREEV